jgi:xanthine dehydrogenase accessory factor
MTAHTLQWVLDELSKNRKVAIASVISTSGSVPGKQGARLALSDFGTVGTVGGAGLELKVISYRNLSNLLVNSSHTG